MSWISQYSDADLVKLDFLRRNRRPIPSRRRWWTISDACVRPPDSRASSPDAGLPRGDGAQ